MILLVYNKLRKWGYMLEDKVKLEKKCYCWVLDKLGRYVQVIGILIIIKKEENLKIHTVQVTKKWQDLILLLMKNKNKKIEAVWKRVNNVLFYKAVSINKSNSLLIKKQVEIAFSH